MGSYMKHETIVSVDEATKKFMGFINEEISATISDGINGALRKTNSDLEEICERSNTIFQLIKGASKAIENVPSEIEQSQKKVEQIIASEFLKNQQFLKETDEDTKISILAEQKIMNEALNKTNSELEVVTEKANTILLLSENIYKAIENISSEIEQSQKKAEEIVVSGFLKNQQLNKDVAESIKTDILEEQKMRLKYIIEISDTYSKKQEAILAKMLEFEDKLSIANAAMEGQNLLLERLGKIEEKINYIKLPFYKKWFNKGV